MKPVLALLLAALLLGCGSDAAAGGDGQPRLTELLCAAATADDVDAAHDAFAAAHDGLHDLARALQDDDERAAAAGLLETKAAVETDVAEDAPLVVLAPHLDELLDAVDAANTALDRPGATCP